MSHLLRITTGEIPGGLTEPRRISVSMSNGTRNVVDYPEHSSGIDAHEYAISQTITREIFDRIESFYKVGETERGYQFTIFLKGE